MMKREQIERVSKALADETRLIIFEAIARRGEMNCSEIVSLRGVTPATVSHHLKVLADAQLIECRRQGQFVYSNPIPGTMQEYTRSLAKIVQPPRQKRSPATR
jgi:ArsR family transcriptional regulator, arsenate/arsenite/antimonite-responsive transcriptional repressor